MLKTEIKRCCGTCYHWEPEGTGDFKERCKFRFRQPFCRLNNKPQCADSQLGCLVWKSKEQ